MLRWVVLSALLAAVLTTSASARTAPTGARQITDATPLDGLTFRIYGPSLDAGTHTMQGCPAPLQFFGNGGRAKAEILQPPAQPGWTIPESLAPDAAEGVANLIFNGSDLVLVVGGLMVNSPAGLLTQISFGLSTTTSGCGPLSQTGSSAAGPLYSFQWNTNLGSQRYEGVGCVAITQTAGKVVMTGELGRCDSASFPAASTAPAIAPPDCIAPNIRGFALTRARAIIVGAGCAVGKLRFVHSATVEKGRVLSQSVRPFARVAHGTRIPLVVSAGRKKP